MLQSDLLDLIKKYYRPTTFTHGEIQIISEIVERIPKDTLEIIFRDCVTEDVRPSIPLIRAKLRGLDLSYGSFAKEPPLEIDCNYCLDTGYVLMDFGEGEPSGIFARCFCDEGANTRKQFMVRIGRNHIGMILPFPKDRFKPEIKDTSDKGLHLTLMEKMKVWTADLEISEDYWRSKYASNAQGAINA